MNALKNYLGPWMNKPFDPEADIWQWALFVVFIVTVAIIWRGALRYIEEGLDL